MALTLDDTILSSEDFAQTRQRWQKQIHQRILSRLDLQALALLDATQVRDQVFREGDGQFEQLHAPLSRQERHRILNDICDDILGLGPIEPLLADPTVTDILVNGPDHVYVERRGRLEPVPVRFLDEAHLYQTIERLVSRIGRRLDESSPMVDARLDDGSRVNAVIRPLALDGPILSIRRFPAERLTLEGLAAHGAFPASLLPLLQSMVTARLNIMISGGTGSGKTTLLNAMSAAIPSSERIITIEDAAELQLQQAHVVRMESRPPNIEGKGEISLRDLVRNSLRMRPDRIVVGEVRGMEFIDMLTAMNTGHDGSLTTIHANTPNDAIRRLESLAAMSSLGLETGIVTQLIASALDVIIQLERMEDGVRRVTSVQELVGVARDRVELREICRFERYQLSEEGRVQGDFMSTGYRPAFRDKLKRRSLSVDEAVFTEGILQ